MNKFYTGLILIIFLLLPTKIFSQTFNGKWSCDYATDDDGANGIGYNSASIGVIDDNAFVALASSRTGDFCYLVGYANADSANGRLGQFEYQTSYRMQWLSGFDQATLENAFSLTASSDSLIYVANNDQSRNILVFKMSTDSIVSTDYRMETATAGADSIFAVALDGNGYVYVSSINKDSTKASEIFVYKGIKDDGNWSGSHTSQPVAKITLPDPGQIRGLAANPQGTVVYASNFTNKKIYCFVGNPSNGYSLYSGFNFTLNDAYRSPADSFYYDAGPIGMTFMKDKNILFVACGIDYSYGPGYYEYGKIYAINPNTGSVLDTIDTAKWNYDVTGTYNNRINGIASGYTSTYDVAFDKDYNLYDQSYFGWTVDKWTFSGTLPTIPLTITGISKEGNTIPKDFTLNQNYPNPFNPSTNITFSLNKQSNISLSIYDITGKLVTKLIDNAEFSSGSYKVTFDASRLASGVYIYVLKNGINQLSKKMTLLK